MIRPLENLENMQIFFMHANIRENSQRFVLEMSLDTRLCQLKFEDYYYFETRSGILNLFVEMYERGNKVIRSKVGQKNTKMMQIFLLMNNLSTFYPSSKCDHLFPLRVINIQLLPSPSSKVSSDIVEKEEYFPFKSHRIHDYKICV